MRKEKLKGEEKIKVKIFVCSLENCVEQSLKKSIKIIETEINKFIKDKKVKFIKQDGINWGSGDITDTDFMISVWYEEC